MKDSFSAKRPAFDDFKALFLDEIERHTGQPARDPFIPWGAVGDEGAREQILKSFLQQLEKRFGFRPVLELRQLTNNSGAIESVVVQIYHVFSTMCLVDHINEKAYREKEAKLH